MIRLVSTLLLAGLVACAPEEGADPAEAAPPGDIVADTPSAPDGASLYALDVPLVTQTGAVEGIDVARGHPVLLSMFYTTCPMACPLLIQDIQALEGGLLPEERDGLRVVLVSLDPAHDDPAAMRDVITRHDLDARWTLGAVPEDAVREVAATLGVRYRPLAGGGFAHTAVLTLVDADGRVVARSEGTDGRDALVAKARALLARSEG